MKIHTEFAQNSDAWFAARAGVITASEIKALVTATFKVSKGEGVQTYLAKKAAEWFIQAPLDTFNNFDVEQGAILEAEARRTYIFETGEQLEQVGFISSDDGILGCSPDGFVAGSHGAEIKCPKAETHAGYLLDGVLPDQYGQQVQFSMYVTGFKKWRFMSYRRKFPPFIITVESDPVAQKAIADALAGFLPLFAQAKAKLLALNGGVRPPKPVAPVTPAEYLKNNPDPEIADGRH